MIEANADVAHGSDWAAATNHIKKIVQDTAPINFLERELKETTELSVKSPDEIIQHGSGWSEIENKRRQLSSEPQICQNSLSFDNELMGADEKIWSELIEKGIMKGVDGIPGGYMTQKEWIPLLLESLTRVGGDNWLSRLHLGVLYYANNEHDKAIEQWKLSVAKKTNVFALRNIGFAFNKKNIKDLAIEYYSKAWEIEKSDYTVAIEFLDLLLDGKKLQRLSEVFIQMPEQIINHPRVLVAQVKYNFMIGNFKLTESLLESIILPDLREGDTALTDIWFEIQAKKIAETKGIECDEELLKKLKKELTPPRQIDFRMADVE
jgi:hypothetical protein